ncbi:MAG: hypothetical protein H0W06_00600 [Chloroflexia bacterium]|nr:hypothetical protein [Chloroflexia bacterium]
MAQNVHPRAVMDVSGHSQNSLTMDTYSHVVPATMREATALMGGLFETK